MVGHQPGVRGTARQGHLAAGRIDHIAVRIVLLEQAAHIADVVEKAGHDDMRVVVGVDLVVQRAAAQDIVPRQRDQQRVLDIVVERVAVSDAFERHAGGGRHDLHQPCLRGAEAAAHIGAEKLFQRVRRQLR